MIAMHQTVRVTKDVPEQSVVKGMIGAVIEIFDDPRRAYEVEFVDDDGNTALQATLSEEDLEVLTDASSFR